MVASDRSGMSEEWENWRQKLFDRQVCYMLETDWHHSIKESPSHSFKTLETAWQQALHYAKRNDTVLLLATDNHQRIKIYRSRPKNLNTSQALSRAPLWSAETLAEIFQGAWVNGPDHGWGNAQIGWGGSMVGADIVSILPGYPENKDGVPEMLRELETVMERGPRAVISPVISNKLPRWKSVMQNDDPLGGLMRLGDYARERLPGRVIALCAPKEGIGTRLELITIILSARLNQPVYTGVTKEPTEPDDVIPMVLMLANAPQNHSAYLFPWEPVTPLTGQMLRPDYGVVDDTCNLMRFSGKEVFSCLGEESVIYILSQAGNEHHWQEVAGESEIHIIFIATSSKASEQENGWKQLVSAIIPALKNTGKNHH